MAKVKKASSKKSGKSSSSKGSGRKVKTSRKSAKGKSRKGVMIGAKSIDHIRLNEEIWPLERATLFRPERVAYVRKLLKPQGCVFCLAAKNAPKFENLSVYQSKHSMVVLNKFPYNSGHLLILPKRHEGEMLDLSKEEYADLFATIRLTVEAVKKIYDPPGFNMGLNHGAVAGAGIPEHLHFHLIPRWSGDLNFFPLIGQTKVVIESLEQTYEKYFDYFESQKLVKVKP